MGVEMTTVPSGNETPDKPLVAGKPPVAVPVGGGWHWKVIWDWRKLPQFHSVQIAVFWGAIQGLYSVWPAFQDSMSKGHFAAIGIGMAVVLVLARLTHQPGLD
jgi:hypothetical protein